MKNLIKLLTLLLIFLSCNLAISAPVSENTAKSVALNFIKDIDSRVSTNSMTLVYTSAKSNQNLFYVFNYKNGFVIVAADDRVIPILGYSNEGAFTVPDITDTITGNNFWGWMRSYESQIKYIVDNNISATSEIEDKWDELINPPTFKAMMWTTTAVTPLLTTTWNQNWPYNALCPSDASGPGGHVWVGCVGTAMGQILKYHNYPSQGLGSYGYTSGSYPNTTANFGQTNYNFSSMANSISTMTTSGDTAVARLLYHAAVSCRSAWGAGATSVTYSSDSDPMSRAFVNYFKCAFSTIGYVKKSDYTSNDWDSIIQTELLASRPVYYRGDGSISHAWVCDGVDVNNLYHFNWGWGGSYNGYFALSNLNPGGNTLTNNQHAIIGIKPNDGSTLVTNTTWSGTVTKSTNIAVPDAITLSVNPGAVVKFDENCKLQVFGRILSIGTSSSYAKFTAVDTLTGWLGIKFDNNYMMQEVMADNDTSKFIYSQIEWSKNHGIYSYNYGKLLIDYCKINDNDAGIWNGSNGQTNGYGGGISIWYHPVNINNSEIYNNHATIQGGGFFLITTSNFSAQICQNNIYDNLSDIDGGGFFLSASNNINLSENLVHNNNAVKGAGGALGSGNPNIINNKFCNNTTLSSSGKGGGLYLENCNANIINNLIANNTRNGLYITNNSNPLIVNCHIVNNSSPNYGAGMRILYNSNPSFKNVILYGNSSPNGSQSTLETTDCDPYFDHCDVQGGYAGFYGPGAGSNYNTANYTNNIDSNPIFVAPTSGAGTGYNGLTANWQLQSTSPCINAGDTTGISQYLPIVDLAESPRINGIIDMGAYEYGVGPTITTNPVSQSVCEGANVLFTVAASGSSLTYQWYQNNNLLSGATNDSLSIINVDITDSGNYHCIVMNSYGSDTSNTATLSVNTVPDTVSISGDDNVCQTDTVLYSVAAVTGANSYTWIVPSGFNILSGAGTTSISVQITTSATSGNIIAYASNGCGNGIADTLWTTVNPLPGNAGTISGPTNVCRGTSGVVYTVPVIANANNYNWSVASGINIVSGGNTNSITVDFTTNAISGNISVYGSNGCGNGQSSDLFVTVNYVTADAGIDDTIPYGTSTTLSGSASNGSGNYTWDWQPDTLLVNANIQNPTTVVLYASTMFTLTVTDTSTGCVDEDSMIVNISGGPLSVNASASPGNICNGDSSQLNALAGGGSGSYTYSWTSNPAGFSSNLQDPVVYPTITTTYIVVVNDGFNTVSDSVEISVNYAPVSPSKPSGPDTVNLNLIQITNYTTNSVFKADYYLWEIIPANAGSLSTGNDTIVTVTWDTGYTGNCSLTVKAVNNCGQSQNSDSLIIYVDYITSVNEVEIVNVNIFPNPCDGRFTITSDKLISAVYLYDVSGRMVKSHLSLNPPESSFIKEVLVDLPTGMYFVHVYMGRESMIRKVVVK
ncbi:C10 family peptidase [Candidatus Gracilibacteria bacterium]|nr:C10 family peptidase [Candidatus Gracilibacteria bacterium]